MKNSGRLFNDYDPARLGRNYPQPAETREEKSHHTIPEGYKSKRQLSDPGPEILGSTKTAVFFHVTPRHRWDRERVLSYLDMLESLSTFKEWAYSISPARFNRYGNPKQAGLNLTFNSPADKKAFFDLEFTKYIWSELEKLCGDGLDTTTSEDEAYKKAVAE